MVISFLLFLVENVLTKSYDDLTIEIKIYNIPFYSVSQIFYLNFQLILIDFYVFSGIIYI